MLKAAAYFEHARLQAASQEPQRAFWRLFASTLWKSHELKLEMPCAGVALLTAFFSWQQASGSWLLWPSTLLSASVGVFLVYNLLAGGNPPPGEKPLADQAPHKINN